MAGWLCYFGSKTFNTFIWNNERSSSFIKTAIYFRVGNEWMRVTALSLEKKTKPLCALCALLHPLPEPGGPESVRVSLDNCTCCLHFNTNTLNTTTDRNKLEHYCQTSLSWFTKVFWSVDKTLITINFRLPLILFQIIKTDVLFFLKIKSVANFCTSYKFTRVWKCTHMLVW